MNIFLSYPHSHFDVAEHLAARLRAEGHAVFHDRSDLPPGDGYDDRIRKSINDCSFFITLVTKDSLTKGKYALSELGFVKEKWPNPSGRVLPVMLEEEAISTLPAYLKSVTVLRPEGELVADIVAAVAAIERQPMQKILKFARVAGFVIASVGILSLVYFSLPSNPISLIATGQEANIYTVESNEGIQKLEAETEYLVALANAHEPGGFISGSYLNALLKNDLELGWFGGEAPMPSLRLGIANNSADIALIDRIRVQVSNSYVDGRPLFWTSSWPIGQLSLSNSGWGTLQNVNLKFDLVEFNIMELANTDSIDANHVWQYSRSLENIEGPGRIGLSLIDEYNQLCEDSSPTEEPAEESTISSVDSGVAPGDTIIVAPPIARYSDANDFLSDEPCGPGSMTVIGILEYTIAGEDSAVHQYHFTENVPFEYSDPLAGAYFDSPSGTYQMFLRADEETYVWEQPISHYTSANDIEAIDITMNGEMSSIQTLLPGIHVNGEWIDSEEPILLHYYQPPGANWNENFTEETVSDSLPKAELDRDLTN